MRERPTSTSRAPLNPCSSVANLLPLLSCTSTPAGLRSQSYGSARVRRIFPCQNVLDHSLQDWQIIFHNRPNQTHFDSKVPVDEDIAPANRLGPYLLRMQLPELHRQPTGGLAEDEEIVNDPGLHQFVLLERSTPPRGVLLDMLNGFQNVLKTGAIVPHSTTASARTLSRTRARSPLSVTTSTGAPRASWRSISRPPRSEIVRPASRSTRKSTSLCG